MAFTTPENVRIFLNKAELTPAEAATVDLLITTVDGVITNYCGWDILARDYTRRLSGSGNNELDLRIFPLNTVTLLTVDDTDLLAQVDTDDDGMLFFTPDSGLVFTAGYRNVRVEFNAGHTTVPPDLIHAASWLVAMYFNRIDMENIGVAEEKFNSIDVTYDTTDLPPLVQRVLDRYRVLYIV